MLDFRITRVIITRVMPELAKSRHPWRTLVARFLHTYAIRMPLQIAPDFSVSPWGGKRPEGGAVMFGAGYDAGTLLDPPEASQEATQAVGDDSDPLPAPLAAAGAAPEAEQEAVGGKIHPEKLAQARRIQPGASVPDLEVWGALRPTRKELLYVMRERLTTEEVNRGRPAPRAWSAKAIYNWLKERAPPCVAEATLLDSEEQAAPGLPPPGQPQPTSGLSTETVTDSLGVSCRVTPGSPGPRFDK